MSDLRESLVFSTVFSLFCFPFTANDEVLDEASGQVNLLRRGDIFVHFFLLFNLKRDMSFSRALGRTRFGNRMRFRRWRSEFSLDPSAFVHASNSQILVKGLIFLPPVSARRSRRIP